MDGFAVAPAAYIPKEPVLCFYAIYAYSIYSSIETIYYKFYS